MFLSALRENASRNPCASALEGNVDFTPSFLFNLEVLKTYKTERPVNAAAISPLMDQILLGGGQDAALVTTTTDREKFDARFFHKIFEEEIGTVRGHFGPINAVTFSPDGRQFATGGEESIVRLHAFDDEYFTRRYE